MTKINTLDRAPVVALADLPMFGAAEQPGLFDTPGPVRPVRLCSVVCAVCGQACRISIFADGKLCDVCRIDLVLAESNIRADLKKAEDAHDAAMEALDLIKADEDTQQRYGRAVEARTADAPHWQQRWQKTIQNGGALGVLLAAHDARERAARALSAAIVQTRLALKEIEATR